MSTLALNALSDQLADLVALAGASVVAVSGRQRFSSSGIHWLKGIVVTADHTLKRDEDLRVTLPSGTAVAAQLVGRDPGTDLAVLRLDEAHADFPTATLAAVDKVRVGHLVLAIARSPEDGLGTSVGVVSAASGSWRTWRGATVDHFIQPDLTLYPGFSGSALTTAEGQVIGMNTSGLSRIMAVTIPAVTITARVEQIVARGGVARGYLGVGMQPVRVPAELVERYSLPAEVGVMLLNVEAGSPAAQAGLLLGDVLLTLDGSAVRDVEDVLGFLDADRIGKPVEARLLRGGQEVKVSLTVGERPHG